MPSLILNEQIEVHRDYLQHMANESQNLGARFGYVCRYFAHLCFSFARCGGFVDFVGSMVADLECFLDCGSIGVGAYSVNVCLSRKVVFGPHCKDAECHFVC